MLRFQGKCAACWTTDILCARHIVLDLPPVDHDELRGGSFAVEQDTVVDVVCDEKLFVKLINSFRVAGLREDERTLQVPLLVWCPKLRCSECCL